MATTLFTPSELNLNLYKGSSFGPFDILARESDATTPVDLTGWGAHAKVRRGDGGPVILDLQPSITNGPLGIITFPEIEDETTSSLPVGCYVWDLLLERPTGAIVGPYLAGDFIVRWARGRAV